MSWEQVFTIIGANFLMLLWIMYQVISFRKEFIKNFSEFKEEHKAIQSKSLSLQEKHASKNR